MSPAFSSPAPDIKFTEILRELIENSPYRKNRRPIWEHLNITSGALSQYLAGQARPRFETLVALAHFFGVSLDYLLIGKEPPRPTTEDARPFLRHVDWALADTRQRVAHHDWLVGKIGRRLAEQIDTVAQDLSAADRSPGVLGIEDQIVLESHSLYTKVLCTTLEDDLIVSDEGEVAAGRFFHVLANNIKRDPPRQYEFLLPQRSDIAWETVIHAFRRVMAGELGISQEQMAYCQFRRIDRASFCGNAFYKLDVGAVKKQEPILWETLNPYMSEDGWVAYLLNPNGDMQANALYERNHLTPTLKLFDAWWAMAKSDI